MDDQRRSALDWLAKAERDSEAARRMIDEPREPLLEEKARALSPSRALDQWAKQSGRFLEPTPVLTEARIGGLEHRVWSDELCGVVRKVTYGGAVGEMAEETGDRGQSAVEVARGESLQ